jgi:RHS repeat-associated protein
MCMGGRIDELVASQVSGVWYNHHYDAQGNCILLSNAVGGIEQQYDYDAFGFPYFYTATGYKSGNLKTRFLFTGREWIVDMRVYDYRARLYQPELGRFLQPDPQEFSAGDYNLYRYCHNDPVNSSDPMGSTLTSTGGGDWDWFNGQVAADMLREQQQLQSASSSRIGSGAAGGVMSTAYVTYGGKWSEEDVKAFNEEFAKEWADPATRANWIQAYASPYEFRVTPIHGFFGGYKGLQLQVFDSTGRERQLSFDPPPIAIANHPLSVYRATTISKKCVRAIILQRKKKLIT